MRDELEHAPDGAVAPAVRPPAGEAGVFMLDGDQPSTSAPLTAREARSTR